MESSSLPEYVQFDGHLLPVAWLEGEVRAEFLAFLDDAAAAAEDEAEPYEVEFAADDGIVDDGGVMEDGVDYVYDDVELVDADFEDGLVSDADLADDNDGGAATAAAEEHAARAAEPPAGNARMSVKPVKQFGGEYEAINEMIREYLQADKKRRRARRVAAAMSRLRRQRGQPTGM
ncbi:uncharacterized protein [Oryza sativa Japonica Group]|jgi:hypothetical protein|uniref:Os07g0203500 protein n=3 Tax=Oryza TaxID=4527 RepID=A0A0P0X415_ORYSJ|nr:uncharacterized protein LOC9269213 [Oryza sativa Japonica Group]KAB8104690.1 hypothetical protein EE612_037737 [Oryza sativa]KAF2921853.1 hypothetical protein DAI22_07g066300 [Oryza sativa Japonica Group]BAC79785.1 hypothetical protein [Oryza sativa Japonica Group]BAD31017.1 hypothetical protein [Oryza sativa Japonica Group]BAH93826.1 Os07g0203500 [Oryza sativa Japonica Group]|eukprot:NP_001175098.1 Os07g0203500 [Oryza sativa Japonica Group]